VKIQVNTNESVQGHDDLARQTEEAIAGGLPRFAERITRVEAHLSDVNALKGGADDKRCVLEARPAGLRPIAVSHQADTVANAVAGATRKLARRIDTTLGRIGDR